MRWGERERAASDEPRFTGEVSWYSCWKMPMSASPGRGVGGICVYDWGAHD